jgi:hypothetical protein
MHQEQNGPEDPGHQVLSIRDSASDAEAFWREAARACLNPVLDSRSCCQ